MRPQSTAGAPQGWLVDHPVTYPGIVVERVLREGSLHQRIAPAGAAAEEDLDRTGDRGLRICQQGPLQLWHDLLRQYTATLGTGRYMRSHG